MRRPTRRHQFANNPPNRRPDRIIKSMALRPRAILVATAVAALVVFAVVQDRVTAEGARRYVALQRDAIAGRGQPVTVDEIMQPAIRHSVQQGLLWGGLVVVAGVGASIAIGRTDPGSRIPHPGRSRQ